LGGGAGGSSYVLFAALAGLGYALAFRTSGRIEMAILAHFGLNVHFLLLTYPRQETKGLAECLLCARI